MRYLINLLFLAVIVTSGAFLFSAQSNAQGCTAVIDVETVPESSTLFPYTVGGEFPQEFDLDPFDDGRKVAIPLGGVTTVTQGDVPGWRLRKVVCEAPIREVGAAGAERFIGPGVNYFVLGSRLTLTCDDEGGLTFCTFINAKTNVIPTMSEWGMLALAAGFGIVALFAIRRRKATV